MATENRPRTERIITECRHCEARTFHTWIDGYFSCDPCRRRGTVNTRNETPEEAAERALNFDAYLIRQAGCERGDLVLAGQHRQVGRVEAIFEHPRHGVTITTRLLTGGAVECAPALVRRVREFGIDTAHLDPKDAAELFRTILSVDRGVSSVLCREGDVWIVVDLSEAKAVRFYRRTL